MMSHWALSRQIRPWRFAVFHIHRTIWSQGPFINWILCIKKGFLLKKRLSFRKISKIFSHGYDGTGGVTRRGLPTYRECNLFSGGTGRTLREHTGDCTGDIHIERSYGWYPWNLSTGAKSSVCLIMNCKYIAESLGVTDWECETPVLGQCAQTAIFWPPGPLG